LRSSRLTILYVLARTAVDTLRISIATIVDARRGRLSREDGDARLRWWSNRLLDHAGVRRTTHNPGSIALEPGRPNIVMCNHSSLYDIPLTFVSLGGCIRMLTKRELFAIPLWGRGMEEAEFIAIDRSDHDRALDDLERAKEKMSSGICLWVAPEGTRSKDGSIGDFKKGGFMLALQTGALVIPVGIRGAHRVLPAGTFSLELGHEIEVHIGAPIDAADYTVETRGELMAAVRTAIIGLAGMDDETVEPATASATAR
jgi:1-acyl-sn-glycerol-3-phosphate acyltransferase